MTSADRPAGPPAAAAPRAGAPAARPATGRSGSHPAPRYLAGRYRLERVLGRGAMGTVWAAHDEALHRWVAIKEVDLPRGVPVSEADQVADRAMREARAVASVSDPHVVTIFDLLSIGHAPAIVMELLDARSLAEVLQEGPLDDGAATTVGRGVAAGLVAAHAAGVTHRDVKPGNVLLCRDGRVKLTDFGIARTIGEQTLTATGLLLGSPAYIAPEVAGGRPATAMADAWGLGALLFACVQGVPPFDGGDPFRTLSAVVQDPVPPHPAAGRLGPLIDGLLVKDPAARMTVSQALHLLRQLDDDPMGERLIPRAARPGPAAPRAARQAPPGPASPSGRAPVDRAAGPTATRPGRPARPAGLPPPPWAGGAGSAGGAGGAGRALPPPPWAGTSAAAAAAALPALPAPTVRPPLRGRRLVVAAVLVALLAAAGGFFGVRAIAALARSTAGEGSPPAAAAAARSTDAPAAMSTDAPAGLSTDAPAALSSDGSAARSTDGPAAAPHTALTPGRPG
ncbi:serine/threonine-protein kinase [Nakamurella endophytica]|uniref:serine/threonine-protein kinase n=1 Tax=Nakamurella endophytica TaxID=1748367 RepID=UPI00166ED549|nr:serine/threonine-protein kinase [Nakamurella endophytica]